MKQSQYHEISTSIIAVIALSLSCVLLSCNAFHTSITRAPPFVPFSHVRQAFRSPQAYKAYIGDGNDALEGNFLDASQVTPVSEEPGFLPFENPQQSWTVQLMEEPSLIAGRVLVIAAAAIYGTNFASIKMLNEILPTGVSAVARFGLAAVLVSALVLQTEGPTTSLKIQEERRQATVMGLEIGGWYSVAYLAQAAGLMTVDASKVRTIRS